MTLSPPCFLSVNPSFFVEALVLLGATRPLAHHWQDVLISQRPQLIFEALPLKDAKHGAILPFSIVRHDDSPEVQEAP
jgi:hypothetical protein